MIGTYCRSLRLHWIAVLGVALALSPAVRAIPAPTFSTTLSAQTTTQSCSTSTSANPQTTTLTTLAIAVTSSSGTPQGTVKIEDNGDSTPIASATLNTSGQATVSLYLSEGPHSLVAVYTANSIDYPSSPVTSDISSQCSTSFAVSVSGITPSTSGAMTLTPGDAGTAIVTVTPSAEYVASLTTTGAPGFVTVSCSGLPSLSSCAFTPQTLEILPGQDAGVISTLLIQTESATVRAVPPAPLGHRSSPVAWAVLLPGMLGLGGLAWRARKRRWLQRLSLVLLVGLVVTAGTTGCNPLYNYRNHGPNNPVETPAGTFDVTLTGQSSNGVSATTINTTMVLTVQ
ncbi:MAG: hypothetical protein WBP85_08045 [Terracidiphilus sp.]